MRYRSLRVGSLGKWAPQLHTRLLVSGATQEPLLGQHTCLLPGCHGLWRRFPDVFGYASDPQCDTAVSPDWASNPRRARPAGLTHAWFRLLPVRSPLLREYFLFLGVHEMFQFPRYPPYQGTVIVVKTTGLPHSEIVGSGPARGSPTLIAAMPRPSSARSAEASTLCSYCLPSRKTCCGLLDRSNSRGTADRPPTRSIQHTLHLVRYTTQATGHSRHRPQSPAVAPDTVPCLLSPVSSRGCLHP